MSGLINLTLNVGCPVAIYFHISVSSGIGSIKGRCTVATYSDSGNTTSTTALNTAVTVNVEFAGDMGSISPASGVINPGGNSVSINQGSSFTGAETLSSINIVSLSPTSGTGQTYIIN